MTYNTEEVYGKVEAAWKIVVEPGRTSSAIGKLPLPPALKANGPVKEKVKE